MTDGLRMDYDISEVLAFANQLDRSAVIAQQEIEIFMRKALIVLGKHVVDRTPVGVTANLRGSIAGMMRRTFSGMYGEVFTPSIYGLPVEYGRKAGKMPPVGPLQLWFVRKLGLQSEEALKAAWALAMHMKANDTEGAHMFEEGFDAAQPLIERLFGEVPERILKRIAGVV